MQTIPLYINFYRKYLFLTTSLNIVIHRFPLLPNYHQFYVMSYKLASIFQIIKCVIVMNSFIFKLYLNDQISKMLNSTRRIINQIFKIKKVIHCKNWSVQIFLIYNKYK